MTKIAAADHQKVADLYTSGMTQAAVGAEFGVSAALISKILSRLGVDVRSGLGKPGNYKRKVLADQYGAVVDMYRDGKTLAEVGAEFGITRERVRQIVEAHGVSRTDGGGAIRTFKNIPDKVDAARAKNERMEVRIRATWGMSLDDYRTHVAEHGSCAIGSSPMGKYQQHRKNALARGLAWNFTFAEWWQVWTESGKWDERGRGGYVMARCGDGDTPYSSNTVYICTQGQNAKDSFIVHPDRRAGVRTAADEQAARAEQMKAKFRHSQNSKLTTDEARSIRIDGRPGTEVAATYGVSTATVSMIRSGKTWKHV